MPDGFCAGDERFPLNKQVEIFLPDEKKIKKLIVGSNANNSGNAGLSNFNSNNSVSNSNTNVGFQSVSSFMSFS